MKTVILTGASGFVGKNLQPYLENRGYALAPMSIRHNNSIYLPPADAIVHLAGKAHDTMKVSLPGEYYQANTELTKKVFDIFLDSEMRVFIMLSSVKAAADSVDGVLTEDVASNPLTPYGKSKLLAEQYILSKAVPEGKRVYILRPCMIHGPGNKGNLNMLYRLVKNRFPYPLAAFDNRRSFLSVDNLSFVVKELIERKEIVGGIYQVSDDIALSTNHVIEIIASIFNRNPQLLNLNKSIIKMIARVGDFLPLPIDSEKLKKLTENYIVSNRKLIEALAKPLPVDSVTGLKLTIKSFLNSN